MNKQGIWLIVLALCVMLRPVMALAQDVPMGRYVESDVALPVTLQTAYDMTVEDGELAVYGLSDQGIVRVARAQGAWTCQGVPLGDGLDVNRVVSLSAHGGKAWILYYDDISDVANMSYQVLCVDESGVREMSNPSLHEDITSPIALATTDEGGVLLYDMMSGTLRGYDPVDFSEIVRMDSASITTAAADGLLATLSQADRCALVYDARTGEELYRMEGAPVTRTAMASPTVMADRVALSGQDFYIANASGVYRVAVGGSVWERLVDGSLTSLSMPSMTVQAMEVMQDGIYVLCVAGDQGTQIKRYAFDESVETMPSQSLSIYTLRENTLVQQAASRFQIEHPTYRVGITVLLSEELGATEEDVLRVLNTEMLSGKGPDLLVMDGLPLRDYAGKGMLMNLQGALDEENLMGNVMGAMREDGALFAAPTAFSMPLLLGKEDVLSEADGLQSLVRMAREWTGAVPALPRRKMGEYFDMFAATGYGAWFDGDGALREEAFTAYLAKIQDIAGACGGGAESAMRTGSVASMLFPGQFDAMNGAGGEFLDVVRVGQGKALCTPMMLDSLPLSTIEMTLLMQMGGTLIPLPGQADHVLAPRGLLAVNAHGDKTDAALDFVRVALSEPVQTLYNNLGFPVNRAAMRKVIEREVENSGFQVDSVDPETGEAFVISYGWPDAALRERVYEVATSLTRAYVPDHALMNLVRRELAPFFDGECGARDAARAVGAKVRAYLAE